MTINNLGNAVTLSDAFHEISMTIGAYILNASGLASDDRSTLLTIEGKLQTLAADFIDQDISNILQSATKSLAAVNAATASLNSTALQIADVGKVLNISAGAASLGFSIFLAVSTGNVGGIPGSIQSFISVLTSNGVNLPGSNS